MANKTLLQPGKPQKSLNRKVRKDYRAGDQIGYKTLSFSKTDGTEYHPALDVKTGEWSCDCAASRFNPSTPCKHVKRAAQSAVRSGEARPTLLKRLGVTCCFRCFDNQELRPMVHDDGRPAHDVFICMKCVRELQQETSL